MAGNSMREDYFVLGKGQATPRRWPALILGTALLVALVFVPAIARAGKGGNGRGHGSGSTLSDPTGGVMLSDAAPHFGNTITIAADYSIPNGVKYSVGVSIVCQQNGHPVFMDAQFTLNPDAFAPQFTLGPSSVGTADGTYYWTGGAANCTADLFYYTWQGQTQAGSSPLAGAMEFDVAAA
jgi:hypothetical protein